MSTENFAPRPETRREFMDKLIDPYDVEKGNPNQIFANKAPVGTPEFNRSLEISQKNNDTDINVSISLEENDSAIQYYFDNVLKLSVMQNNQRKRVPVIYGSPERWKSVQADGYYRDKAGKIQVPLIIYRRDRIDPMFDLGNKIDGNNVKNIILAERNYNKKNVYNNFNVLNNRIKEKQYIVAFPPDYVKITYSVLMYTYFSEQMNDLIEAISFANRSYWGDPNNNTFRVNIDSFTSEVNVEAGEERMVKSGFTITLFGRTIPDSLNREVAVASRMFGPAQVSFGIETAESTGEFKLESTKKNL